MLLRELTRPALRSWWTVVAGICLGLSAARLAQAHVPARYRATATLRCEAALDARGLQAAVTRREALERLAAREPTVRHRGVVDRLSVGSGPEGLWLTVSDPDPRRAAALAGALGDLVTGPAGPCTWATADIGVAGPFRPPPARLHLLGLAVGLIAFLGPSLVRAAMDPVVSDRRSIDGLSGARVLEVIPRVATREVAIQARRRLLLNIGLSLAAVATGVAVALVHSA